MILFVGDKPSAKNISPYTAFVGTQSYKRLLEWIWQMDVDISKVKLHNSTDIGLETYLVLSSLPKSSIFKEDLKVVVLGNNAEKVVKKYNHPYFKLPHPSGLNRKLNDKKWLKGELDKCRKWLET